MKRETAQIIIIKLKKEHKSYFSKHIHFNHLDIFSAGWAPVETLTNVCAVLCCVPSNITKWILYVSDQNRRIREEMFRAAEN